MKGLNWANTALTVLVGIAASIGAILSSINKSRIEMTSAQVAQFQSQLTALDVSLKKLDVTEKEAKERSAYADVFLQKVLPDPVLKDNAKHVQALLSVLSIIAQTSSGDEAKARAIMPLQLALLLGQPGGVAAMDVDYKYLDDWVAMALADDSPLTRLTAIQALAGVCQKALRQGRLDVVLQSVDALNQLLAVIPEEQATVRASAIASRSQLASVINKEPNLLEQAKLKPGDTAKAEDVRDKVRKALADAESAAVETKNSLQSTYSQLQDSSKPDTQKVQQVKASLDQLDAALKNASQVKVAKAISGCEEELPSDPNAAAQTATELAVKGILPKLTSDDANVRRRAQVDLALLGQDAVKPLIKEAASMQPLLSQLSYQTSEPRNKKAHDDHLIRFGIAEALQSMRQPVELDDDDAYWVVDLLRAKDGQIRRAVEGFLVNLESGDSVRNCFEALDRLFNELCRSPKPPQGNTVASITAIVGTWARNIPPDTDSRVPGKSFPVFALETSKSWRVLLAGATDPAAWAPVLETLDKSIKRAEGRAAKLQAGAVAE